MEVIRHEDERIDFEAFVFLTIDKTLFQNVESIMTVKQMIPVLYCASDTINLIFEFR